MDDNTITPYLILSHSNAHHMLGWFSNSTGGAVTRGRRHAGKHSQGTAGTERRDVRNRGHGPRVEVGNACRVPG